MDMATIFTATPAEIDTEIAALQDQRNSIQHRMEFLDKITGQGYTNAEIDTADAELVKLIDKGNILVYLLKALNDERSRRGGWKRVYAVNNSNGHFHRTQACSTTYHTTSWVWMTELSGLTNEEVVAKTGKMSCLVCFGSQRAEIEKGREATVFTPAQKKSREERDEFARKSAELALQKASKEITSPDGTPLKGGDGYVIKTVRTAWIEAVSELEWAAYTKDGIEQAEGTLEGDSLQRHIDSSRLLIQAHQEIVFRIAQAIAVKEDRPPADVLTEIVAKADKKIAKSRKQAQA